MIILSCNCYNEAQDKIYGKGKRVFNKTRKGDIRGVSIYRCTVCKAEKESGKK